MPLCTMTEILDDAQKKGYGVGYYNTVNQEMIRACIRAAEDEKSPIIIGTAEGLINYSAIDWLAPMLLDAAKRAKIPVAVHLDHAYRFDTVMCALRAGFGSVMFDGSSLKYEENIKISRQIADIAHPMGVGLECELGKVGGLDEGEGILGENIYTDPMQAKDFVERSKADFLAISIGTVHGVYAAEPKLDIGRLSEIKREVDVPLVLHGGSGLTESDFKSCIKHGIVKVNIFTDVIVAAANEIRSKSELSYLDLMLEAENAMYAVAVANIRKFESNNKT